MSKLPAIAPLALVALLACAGEVGGGPPPSVACTLAPAAGAFAGDTLSYTARLDGLGGSCHVRHGEEVTFISWTFALAPGEPPPPAEPGRCTLPYDVDLRTGVTSSAFLVFEFDDAEDTVVARYGDADSPSDGETYVFPPGACLRR